MACGYRPPRSEIGHMQISNWFKTLPKMEDDSIFNKINNSMSDARYITAGLNRRRDDGGHYIFMHLLKENGLLAVIKYGAMEALTTGTKLIMLSLEALSKMDDFDMDMVRAKTGSIQASISLFENSKKIHEEDILDWDEI